jgi:hypothetical protein
MKTGIVITTHGNNGFYIKRCIESFLKYVENDKYIVVFINESSDPITLNCMKIFKSFVHFIYINDQKKNGGLTGTWNAGILLCIKKNCETIILSNDDLVVNKSVNQIIKYTQISQKKKNLNYFGPVSNNPGVGIGNKENQYAINSTHRNGEKIFIARHPVTKKPSMLNGFFLSFPVHVLVKNFYSKPIQSNEDKNLSNIMYFNPDYPFGGNEVEWFDRFSKKFNGIGIVIPQCFVYHEKLKTWQSHIYANGRNGKNRMDNEIKGRDRKVIKSKHKSKSLEIKRFTNLLHNQK